jgi:hypothetical protein
MIVFRNKPQPHLSRSKATKMTTKINTSKRILILNLTSIGSAYRGGGS